MAKVAQSQKMPAKLAKSAFELFAERGFGDVTIDNIAAHAGVTKGSFYSHYDAKHDIVLASCSYYYRDYHRQVADAMSSVSEPLARLRCALEHAVRVCVGDEQSRVFTAEIFALSLQDDEVRRGWAQFYDAVREMYVGLIQALQTGGIANISDPRKAGDLMLATIEGIKMQATITPYISEPEKQRAMVDGLLKIVMSYADDNDGTKE